MADATTKKPDNRWLTDIESIEPRPIEAPDPYWLPPTPPSGAELWPTRRPGDPFSAANPEMERLAADLGIGLREGDWRTAAIAGAGLAANLTQGKVRQGAKPKRADVYRRGSHDPNVRELQGPGFYSHMLAELKDMERGGRQQGNAAAWLKELKRAQVKPKEIAGSGMDRYLTEQQGLIDQGQRGPITRQELVEFARANQPHIEEKRFGGDEITGDARQVGRGDLNEDGTVTYRFEDRGTKQDFWVTEDKEAGNVYVKGPKGYIPLGVPMNRQSLGHAQDAINTWIGQQGKPADVHGPLKWGGEYGGQDLVLASNPTNREYVLGLKPSKRAQEIEAEMRALHDRQVALGDLARDPNFDVKKSMPEQLALEAKWEDLRKQLHIENQGRYQEPHFREVNDYIGHGRGGEYKLGTGENTWLMDEVQNTRAQKIRDQGGRDPSTDAVMQKRVDDAAAARDALYAQAEARARDLARQRVGAEGDKTFDMILANADSVRPYRIREMMAMMEPGWKEKLEQADRDHTLAVAEQRAKLESAPGHPLVDDMATANRLGLRHQLLQAAGPNRGSDSTPLAGVTLTSGKLQNERYNLSHPLSEIAIESAYYPGKDPSRTVYLFENDSPLGHMGVDASGKILNRVGPIQNYQHISDVLGPYWGDRALKSGLKRPEGTYTHKETFKTPGLEIGGQGMRDYYDRQYPDILNSELKRLSGGDYPGQRTVALMNDPDPKATWPEWPNYPSDRPAPRMHYDYAGNVIPFRHFPFTDKIREEIKKGLPFYAVPPLGLAAASGSWLDVNPSDDDMKFADGGKTPTLSEITENAGEQLTGAQNVLHKPWLRPSLVVPSAIRMMTEGVREMTRRNTKQRGGRGFADGGEVDPLRSIESIKPRPIEFDPYWLPPDPPSAELRASPGRPGDLGQQYNEELAGRVGAAAREGDWLTALGGLSEIVLGAVPAVGRRARKPTNKPTLEQAVDQWKSRPSTLDYDTYLQEKDVSRSLLEFETQESPYKNKAPPQEVKNLSHWRIKDDMRRKRDAGLLEGPEGYPVNPWYWPNPVKKAFKDRLGEEIGEDQFKKFMGFNAATSMQTAVPRNIVEAWMLYHHDLNQIPFKRLGPGELSGAATNNKVLLGNKIATGEGLTTKDGPKVRNYWLNLQGAGAEPHYVMTPRGYEAVTQPVTLDKMMAEAMRYRKPGGEERERFVGAPYRAGVDVINDLAREVGAAAPDTQAAIWQSHQQAKHTDPTYEGRYGHRLNAADPFARIFDDVIHRIAQQEGVHPEKILDELIEGRRLPPNFWYSQEGKKDGGGIDPMRDIESIRPRPIEIDPYWLPPEPPRYTGEIRATRRPGDLGQEHNEELARRIGDPDSDWLTRLGAMSEIVLGTAFSGGRGKGRGPKGSSRTAPGAGAEKGELPQRGGLPRGDDWLSASRGSSDPYTPIPGQPATVKIPGHGEIEARPLPGVEIARRDYLSRSGMPNQEPAYMPKLDVDRARRIAQAYEEMKHDPTNPDVRKAYEAMINETLGQLDALERQGYRFKFNKPGEDPYAASPALGYLDVRDKGELSVFPTLEGFGSGVKLTPAEVANNPLLTDVGRKWGESPITANDAFRAVHDMFGHFGPGNPFFRAPGEERAWGHHSLMYSPAARGAMTSETRGQNSWLNFGPHGEHNKTASGADTIYADQKTGLMPDWTWLEGVPPIREEKASGGVADGGGWEAHVYPEIDLGELGETVPRPPVDPIVGNGINDPYGYGDSINKWFTNGQESIFGPDDGRAALMQADRDDFGRYDEARQRKMEPVNYVGSKVVPRWTYGPLDRESIANSKYQDRLPERADGGDVEQKPKELSWLDTVGGAAAMLDEFPLMRMPSTAAGLLTGTPLAEVNAKRQRAIDEFQGAYPRLTKAWGEMSEYPGTPTALGVWLGLPGIRKLEQAGRLHADDYRGSNRWPVAKKELNEGRPPAEVWEEHGVGDSRLAFPGHAKRPPLPESEYFTALPLGDAQLPERFLRDVRDFPQDVHKWAGPLGRSMWGQSMDDFNVAVPEVSNTSAALIYDPKLPYTSGSTRTSPIYPSPKQATSRPIDNRVEHTHAKGPSTSDILNVMRHEATHGVQVAQKVPSLPPDTSDIGMRPLLDTQAKRFYDAEAQRFQKLYEEALHGGQPKELIDELRKQASFFYDKARAAGTLGDYLASPWEDAARKSVVLDKLNPDESMLRRMHPGDLDSYAPGAFIPEFEREQRVPLDYFRPPTNKQDGGPVKEKNWLTDIESISPRPIEFDPNYPASGPEIRSSEGRATRPIEPIGQRPYDRFAQPLAEALSPTMGAYDTAQMIMRMRDNAKDQDWGALAEDAPSALGMFIGLPGVKRMQKSGYRHPDDWGGSERLRAAQKEWKLGGDRGDLFEGRVGREGMTPAEVWREYGWMPPNAWDSGAGTKPSTIVAAPDLRENQAFRSVAEDQTAGRSQVPASMKLTAASALEGIDPFIAAMPDLRKMPLEMVYAPSAYDYKGSLEVVPRAELSRDGRVKWNPVGLMVRAPTWEDMRNVAFHELAHFGQVKDEVPHIGRVGEHQVHGTRVEQMMREQYLAEKEGAPGPLDAYKARLPFKVTRSWLDLADETPRFAGYLDTPWERAARARTIIGNRDYPEIANIYPPEMDTYRNVSPRDDLMFVESLSAYDPNRRGQKAAGGVVMEPSPPEDTFAYGKEAPSEWYQNLRNTSPHDWPDYDHIEDAETVDSEDAEMVP